jgi:ferredoxin
MSEIKIKLDNKEVTINQKDHFSLLIAMEKSKLPVEYGCLMGVCGVCEIKVSKGKENIEYFEKPMLDMDKDSILPCCCVANGDIELKNV